ncbi:regulatory protein GemA [Desulfovibrio sp. OttesenSCG-928-C14]|nr:regulatory protein GemA [Desulfovibrio sp. OttesenSCG-928-C14]
MAAKVKKNPKYFRFIYQTAKDLGMTEEERRTRYEEVTGKRNLDDMDNRELGMVCDDLRAQALKRFGGPKLCQNPQACKVRSLWLELRDAGALRDPSERALLTYIKRRTGVDRMEWLKPAQLSWLIEQLKSWLARVEEKRLAESEVA